MIDEYIKKDDAIEAFREEWERIMPDSDRYLIKRSFIAEALKTIPPADVVERKRGEWIYQESCDSDRYEDYKCSNCGTLITVDARRYDDIGFVIEDFYRCLNCGAYMKGTDDE